MSEGKWSIVVAILMIVAHSSTTNGADKLNIAVKVWHMTPNVDFGVSYDYRHIESDAGVMVGPQFTWLMSEQWWLSGMYLVGSSEYSMRGRDYSIEEDQQDGELMVGYSMQYWDIGFGVRYTSFSATTHYYRSTQDPQDVALYGPTAYVGTSYLLPSTPLGVYGGASIMFADLSDGYEDSRWSYRQSDIPFEYGEHYNIEAGIVVVLRRWSATLGYRIKDYYRDTYERKYDGITATVGRWF